MASPDISGPDSPRVLGGARGPALVSLARQFFQGVGFRRRLAVGKPLRMRAKRLLAARGAENLEIICSRLRKSSEYYCSHLSVKLCSYPDIIEMHNILQSIDDKILRSIRAHRSANAFSPKHFSRLGTPVAVWQALARLTRGGKLRRIRRGLYDLPKAHPLLGQTAPDPMAVVEALMQDTGAQWQFSGAYAANRLGLSEQVPAKILVLTDGPPRRVPLGKLELIFRHAAPRNLLGADRPAGLVIQALRHLRKTGLSPNHVERLRQQLDVATKDDLTRIRPNLPGWMQSVVAAIVAPSLKS